MNINRQSYNAAMAAGKAGEKLSKARFNAVLEFARAKRIKQPDAAWLMATPVKEPKEPKVKAKCDPSLHGSDEACDKDSRSNGVCATHYSRLVYRAQADKAEKAREASRNYAAKQRAQKAAEKAAAEAAA